MKSFENCTYRGQLRRLSFHGRKALQEFGLEDGKMTFLQHGENTTYRVAAKRHTNDSPIHPFFVKDRYVLRIHRPGYQDRRQIESEMLWMQALLNDTGLAVPQPVPTLDGNMVAEVKTTGIPGIRLCSVLRWLDGRFSADSQRASNFHEIGETMARFHEHARLWKFPNEFARRKWDWDGLFGKNSGFHLPPEGVWDFVPKLYRSAFSAVADQAMEHFEKLGTGPEVFGLLHADLHLGNIKFRQGKARVFDFDDCGFGYLMYDIAVTISECMEEDGWQSSARSFLDGYSAVRPLPDGYAEYLDLFLAARRVSLALWAIDLSQINAGFGENVGNWVTWLGDQIVNFVSGDRVLSAL